jgi:hypothetical protein
LKRLDQELGGPEREEILSTLTEDIKRHD